MDGIGKLAVIGAGAMGTAFAGGIISAGLLDASDIVMTDVDAARLSEVSESLGVRTTSDNAAAVVDAQTVLVALKPPVVHGVLRGLAGVMKDRLIISMVTGASLDSLESVLPERTPLVRCMPNTPCLIGQGAIGFSRGSSATDEHVAIAKRVFDAVGLSYEVPEKLLNAVTGLSGSGPAYIYVLIDALSDAGVRVGLPRDVATKLGAQTVKGAAQMVLDRGEHPAKLKDQVTTPGGTTITALDALERAGFRSAIIEAVKAATRRAEELA